MSRAPVDPKRIVRTKTLEELELDLRPFADDIHQSHADMPKVVRGAGDPHDINSPALARYSKVILSRQKKVQRPPHLSEWCKIGSFDSPLGIEKNKRTNRGLAFVSESETIMVDIIASDNETTMSREFMRCGPRKVLAFHPKNQVKACIVTCGGLCPGLNNVIRELVITLIKVYGVPGPISGIRYGLKGFYSTDIDILPLTLDSVSGINHIGGTILGSSRGGFDCQRIFNAIESYGFNQVYMIGGDGTHRAINALFAESKRRKSHISICGVTKSIDQDVPLIDRCFGFDTAVGESQRSIRCAKVEAMSAENGIGLVQLMGRHSGNIAMFAALASREVDCCLVPEVEFVLEGRNGLFEHIRETLAEKGHMVIVVAEGAGGNLVKAKGMGTDASGNAILPDIGNFLKDRINKWAKEEEQMEVTLKMINPTYMIRSIPANASDQLFCSILAQSAVHGAMAGFTGFTTGYCLCSRLLISIHACMTFFLLKAIGTDPIYSYLFLFSAF